MACRVDGVTVSDIEGSRDKNEKKKKILADNTTEWLLN